MTKKSTVSKSFLLVVISILIIISGCQGNQSMDQQSKVKSTMRTESVSNQYGSPEPSGKSALKAEEYQAQETIERKIITKKLESIPEQVKTIIKTYDGYLANSNQWQSDRKYYRYNIKIPQENFQTAISELEKLGAVNNKQISSRDITKEYIDLQSRLKNFKAQEERYLELLNQAKNVKDMLTIEKELNRVRRKIEQIQGQLNYYNNKINFSTINITFTEPKPVINNNSWGIFNSLKQAIQEFVNSINAIIVISGALLPWLLLISVLALIAYKLYQKKKNK
ncbi:DUF4349 domain-containing protein [Halanaerobacter jeridensis]|uniref:DUF4349 domain-containing protein n=1 Tax=Halanaerobacter jeridensis TaxID=706427 RepID=A0A938XQR8_9FIRM|nr:DUF4349 domain-containing protein [Halanaerobacter jeridensis]MBM7555841.1 hypothetical protein [Halanaerobacter jeridensis]